jgi:hypothetical protein
MQGTGNWIRPSPQTFKALMRRYARRSELGGRHQINGLGRGIREFKVGTKRLSFCDTDGTGGYVERETIGIATKLTGRNRRSGTSQT